MFISTLEKMKKRHPFELYAFCLMTNHFHLLLRVESCSSSLIMQAILTSYSHYFNRRHDRVGHLFQNRYNAILCETDAYLLTLIQYIHLNPVGAGLVHHPSDWFWSGHHDYFLEHPKLLDTTFPLSLFGSDRAAAAQLYARFLSEPQREFPGMGALESFTRDMFEPLGRTRTLEDVAMETAALTGISEAQFRGKSRARTLTSPRRSFLELALKHGYTSIEVALFLNRSKSSISRLKDSLA